jgi:arginase family enzyme
VNAVEELALLLRPAGGGLFLLSTGRRQQLELQRQLYSEELSLPAGASDDAAEAAIRDAFLARLHRIAAARIVLIGAPSDAGAGYRRGANLGPWGVREALLRLRPDWAGELAALGGLDLGDVFVVPQLLHDDMLSTEQHSASGAAIYPALDAATRAAMPVSPLSMLERALDLVQTLNPSAIPMIIGGDHSNAWPVVASLAKRRQQGSFGIVQPDAHTDLLAERLGIKYCFATWSWHANELLGRGGRLVQVGIRATRHHRGHWESTLGVVQRWADECNREPERVIDEIVAHYKALGVGGIYFSNDIDGTDEAWASSTGTPEKAGLDPQFVIALVRKLGAEIGLVAGDVMEVAPPLGPTPEDADRTCRLAATYLRETIYAALRTLPAP